MFLRTKNEHDSLVVKDHKKTQDIKHTPVKLGSKYPIHISFQIEVIDMYLNSINKCGTTLEKSDQYFSNLKNYYQLPSYPSCSFEFKIQT